MGTDMLYKLASSRARLKRNHSPRVGGGGFDMGRRCTHLSPGTENSTSHSIKDRSRKEDQEEHYGMPEEPTYARIQRHPVGTP